MTLEAGSRVGQYEISAMIGAGGMGEVFQARDHVLQRDVAIKMLPPGLAADPERRLRLTQEARLLAALNHPHVAQVFGIEETAAGSAIVMELVPGETLGERLRSTPLGVADALAIARQIALALDAAHDKGIVHRDLKPGNVKVTPDGTVKVLDFGLAKTSGSAPVAETRTAPAPRTAAGTVVGTVAYMSPEQARGQDVDRRTDIWAFGCILFEMFSGRAPFERDTTSDTIAAVLARDPDWPSVRPETPDRILRLMRRCLEKDRRQRLRDIGDALPDLDPNAERSTPAPDRDSLEPAPTTVVRGRAAQLAVAVLLIAAGAVGAWLWGRGRPPATADVPLVPVRFGMAPPSGTRFGSSLPNVEATTMAFSPDGSRLAFIAAPRGKRSEIWIRPLDATDAQPVAGTEGATAVFWSPDGRSLAFFANGKLRRIDQDGGASVAICDVPVIVGLGGTWGADGQILFASVQGQAIYRVSAGGGDPAAFVKAGGERKRVMWPRFLPDGRRFLYSWLGDDHAGGIVLVDADGRDRQLMSAVSQAQFVEPDVVLFVREATLLAQRLDLVNARPVGEPTPLMGPVAYSAATGWMEVTSSPNGMLAAQTHFDVLRLLIVDHGGRPQATVGPPGGYLSVDASPDGSTLLFSRLRPELGTYDIWSSTLPRQSETRVTSTPGTEMGQIWVPGRREMVLSIARGGPPNLFLLDLRTGGERRLSQSTHMQVPTDVSPDGQIVAFQQRTERGNWDVMQLSLNEGAAPQPLIATAFTEASVRFAPPRGDRIAYVSDQSGRTEVYVAAYPFDRSPIMVSEGGGFAPRWRPDGRALYFLSPAGKLMAVSIDGAVPAAPVPLFDARWGDFDVLGNGDRFVAVVPETDAREQPVTILLHWQRMRLAGEENPQR